MKSTFVYIILLLSFISGRLWAKSGPDTVTAVVESDTVTVAVLGINENSRFEPAWLEIRPGDVVRFEVKEGLHTVTAYHPDNRRDLGIPEEAESFDSGILSAGDVWFLKITEAGEYNYFCLPHERMGHTGQIISTPELSSTTAGS